MQLIRCVFLLFYVCIAFLVSGCTRSTTVAYTVLPSGYSCLAVNHASGGYAGTAWAKHLFRAKINALDRCRAHSRIPTACKVSFCRWVKGSPISTTGYFTCYVRNNDHYGVWLSTSHNEYRAKVRAMYRCQHFSGQPAACYFDHCWLW